MAVGPKYFGGLFVFDNVGDRLWFRYEPNEWSHDRESRYAESMLPGAGNPFLQWAGNNSLTVSLRLFLNDAGNPDDYETRSNMTVLESIKWILVHTQPSTGLSIFDGSSVYIAPKILAFVDDSTLSDNGAFKCVITSHRVNRLMFDGNTRIPVRAEVDITLKKYVGYIS